MDAPKSSWQKSRELSSHAAQHLGDMVRIKSHPTPWAWMLVSGFSALLPLLVGSLNHEAGISIFGALTGYLIALCDHQGALKQRLGMATFSLFVCWLGFVSGVLVQNSTVGLVAVSAVFVFLIGSFGGKGAEIERAFIFAGIEFFVSRYAKSLHLEMLPQLTFYFGVAYLTAIGGILFTRFTSNVGIQLVTTIRQAYQIFLQRQPDRNFFIATYGVAIFFGIFVVEYFQVERGYWLLVTILLMMRPNRKESVYGIFQRFFGTFLGVLVGEFIIYTRPPVLILEAGVFVFATLVPFVWFRTYWLVSFCATNLVICLLSISQFGHVEPTLTFTRAKVTLFGCAISLLVVGLSQWVVPRRP